MREFYIECNMGASGNRLMSALYELLSQEDQQQFLDTINQLGSFNTSISAIPSSKCNVQGTKLTISTSNEFSFSQYDLSSIKEFILSLPFSKKVKEDAATIYEMIAEAKMTACNCFSLEETVYPERITSIIGVCILIEKLKPERIIVSPIHVGSGFITRDYGSVPVPTPEVAYLLQGVPSYGGPISDELCTTEGAAILTYFADEFGYLPVMTTEKIGCGIGENDYDMANCVRVFSGTVVENTDPALPDSAQLPASFDKGKDNKSVLVTEYPWIKKNSENKGILKFISFNLKQNNHSLSVDNFKKSDNIEEIRMDQYFPYRFLNLNEKKQELPYLFLRRYGLGNMCITVDANSHKVSNDAYAHFSSNDRAIRWSTIQPKKKSIVNIAAHEAEHAYQHKQIGRLTKGSDNYENDCWHKFGPIKDELERREAIKYLKASKIYPLKSDPNYIRKHDSNYLEIKSTLAGIKAEKEYSIGQKQLKDLFPYFPNDINMF